MRNKLPSRTRLEAPGTLHHFAVRGIERRKIVKNVANRRNLVKRLGELSAATKTSIYAWALMTNQFLLKTGDAPVAKVMRRLLTDHAVF